MAAHFATHTTIDHSPTFIKIEDDIEVIDIPDTPPGETLPTDVSPVVQVDPKDPEGFLRRCSGYNKKTKLRCSQTIGRNSHQAKDSHPTFLPTCKTHRDQQSPAGWCQLITQDGERCGRLFRWTPHYFELCSEHQGHPDSPCYFLKLPLELRLEIFSYLLPTGPIGSSTAPGHRDLGMPPPRPALDGTVYILPPLTQAMAAIPPPPPPPPPPLPPPPFPMHLTPPFRPSPMSAYRARPSVSRRMGGRGTAMPISKGLPKTFPIPLLNLFLVNRQVYHEAKDLLFSQVTFVIDVRKDGTFMCGRRLLEPRRADGSSHFTMDDEEAIKDRFIKNFDFRSVKNYDVNILVENCKFDVPGQVNVAWDEEVEIYDIRDYVDVVVSGILGQSRNLCKLNVRLGVSLFKWSTDELLANIYRLVGPFERLRNVRQPRLCGVFEGAVKMASSSSMVNQLSSIPASNSKSLCSVPRLPTHTMLLGPGQPEFDAYKKKWERWLSQNAPTSLGKKAPIRAMFTEFKMFYTCLSSFTPEITQRTGRHTFLHRARVARENQDIEGFRHLRNELIEYWYAYLEQEEAKKDAMNSKLSRMLDMDIYPAHEVEKTSRRNSESSGAGSPVDLNTEKMTAEGIPMQGNQMTAPQRQQYYMMRLRQQQMQVAMATRQASQATQAGRSGSGPSGTNLQGSTDSEQQLHLANLQLARQVHQLTQEKALYAQHLARSPPPVFQAYGHLQVARRIATVQTPEEHRAIQPNSQNMRPQVQDNMMPAMPLQRDDILDNITQGGSPESSSSSHTVVASSSTAPVSSWSQLSGTADATSNLDTMGSGDWDNTMHNRWVPTAGNDSKSNMASSSSGDAGRSFRNAQFSPYQAQAQNAWENMESHSFMEGNAFSNTDPQLPQGIAVEVAHAGSSSRKRISAPSEEVNDQDSWPVKKARLDYYAVNGAALMPSGDCYTVQMNATSKGKGKQRAVEPEIVCLD